MLEETFREFDARTRPLHPEERMAKLRARNAVAEKFLRTNLKAGDRLRATKAECSSREASFTFSGWDGGWIMSKSGCSIAPLSVYSVNGKVLRFPVEIA
ncbi:hypothetical protein [Jiella avicenniae]|uniref:Uncharacterized protein n=1 Tax=Jiella avicenniae TaxID=2907202 RepID=A0A9X1T3M7_9HYPH|nr:hypothetical protein [Jiella avicenniae]MCE7026410.1 hypothetical protein [Jiella avicenniae]